MDVSASFQFLVDALRGDWHAIAPDWRGYGLTQWSGADSYGSRLSGDLTSQVLAGPGGEPAGHSMGATWPVSMPASAGRVAARAWSSVWGTMRRDAGQRQESDRRATAVRDYASFEALASRLQQGNRGPRARVLAEHGRGDARRP
jgi:hypothetical protein